MIKFACTCTKVLQIPDDRAGSSLQCPYCGRLVDVPLLSDLENISIDGTYKVGPEIDREERDRLAQLQRAFAKQRVDEQGHEIDMRPTENDFAGLEGPESLALVEDEGSITSSPKYDPITGELVRPIDIQQRPRVDPSVVPVAKALIGYARVGANETDFPPSRIFVEIFKFPNMTVMMAIFCFHVFLQMMTFVLMAGFFLVAPAFIIFWGLLLSHYAIIVEDVGVENNDDLPRPLRNLSWHDDIWGPFSQLFGSMMICYGLLFTMVYLPPVARLAVFGATMILGTIAFPAVFLTATTSGTFMNLSPDRLLRVVSELGAKYVLCVILWAMTLVAYLVGIAAANLSLLKLFIPPSPGQWYLNVPIPLGYPLMFVGIFVAHVFCWYLGLMYRQHHESFGWAFQRHIRTVPTPPPTLGFPVRPAAKPRSRR